MVINIPPDVSALSEGASGKNMPPGSIEIRNSFGEAGYGGPQPPKGTGPHAYVITIYSLKDAGLDLKPNATLADFQNAIKAKTLDEASLTGFFEQ
jgi:Raf kinase inhibitor-like YbhB/YbcL family protein